MSRLTRRTTLSLPAAPVKIGVVNGQSRPAAPRCITADDTFGHGIIRTDGRTILDNDVFHVKTQQPSHGKWDSDNLVCTVPGDVAFRPIDQGGRLPIVEMAKG